MNLTKLTLKNQLWPSEADTLLTWVGHTEAFGAFPTQARALRRAAEA